MPSAVYEVKSKVDVIGLINNPISPSADPKMNPFVPLFFAPYKGYLTNPVIPFSTPLNKD